MSDCLSLAAAATLDPSEWDDLSVLELDFDDATRDRSARVWLWLCGVADDDSPDADRVRREVLGDGGLMVAIALPAVEFFRWLRAAAWEDFDSTQRTGSEAWAWEALKRAWGGCEALGMMATQCGLRVPCVPPPLTVSSSRGDEQ
jgi:hypothetical protein